jgi:hypothetical protein
MEINIQQLDEGKLLFPSLNAKRNYFKITQK